MMLPLLRRVQRLGFPVFEGTYDLNCVIERASERRAGRLDDLFHLAYRTIDASWHDLAFPCTVDPGLAYLHRPINARGTAILQPGHYPGMWQRGLHHGRAALRQVGPCDVARDGDRDDLLEPGAVNRGIFGIDFHDDLELGADASAGCVVAIRRYVELTLGLLDEQHRAGHGDRLSATVLAFDPAW